MVMSICHTSVQKIAQVFYDANTLILELDSCNSDKEAKCTVCSLVNRDNLQSSHLQDQKMHAFVTASFNHAPIAAEFTVLLQITPLSEDCSVAVLHLMSS